jgi:hypothetical protein
MTTSTVEHAPYASRRTVAPAVTHLHPEDIPEERVEALREVQVSRPDPGAHDRIAAVLYRITGWELFGDDERAYVSRLWAEDWDSPEDTVYDEP